MAKLLVFGASGAIGNAIAAECAQQGFNVIGASRSGAPLAHVTYSVAYADDMSAIAEHGPFDAVCWAQGVNGSDSVYDVDITKHLDIYQANCVYILNSLTQLLEKNLLAKPARLVLISSIWQNIARQNKLSYGMSKAALQGLVQSAAIDLGRDGHLINAILPGVLDTPMTRANLSPDQLSRVQNATLFGRLPETYDIASLAAFLCSSQNRSITGQSIAVDLGFSHAHLI